MTILLFLAVLFVLILVHEFGHFAVAKLTKMRVDEFAIGFPPRIFAVRKGETTYSINSLPIGGYVKILGENGTQEQPLSPDEAKRSFVARPRWAQAAVLVAGVAMNILLAWIIFYAVAIVGQPTAVEEGSAAATDATLMVVSSLPDSPAASSLPVGSEIISLQSQGDVLADPTPITLADFVGKHSSQSIEISYLADDKVESVSVTPQSGLVQDDPKRAVLGISTVLVTEVSESPWSAIASATSRTIDSLVAITVGIVGFFASAFTLSADLSQVAGPVGIAGMVGEAADIGIISLLVFTAFISLNLAVINMLPIPALDGGRLLFVLIESIIRKPINPEWQARVNFVGFALLILLMITVTYSDIVKII